MNKMTYSRVVIIGILFLFIGASVLPIFSGATQNLNTLNTQETLGKNRNSHIQDSTHIHYENNTVKNTKVNQHTEKNTPDSTHIKVEKQVTIKEKHISTVPSFTHDALNNLASPKNLGGPQPLGNNVHNVNTGQDFATIQDAIDDAGTLNGHTLVVYAGTYNENVLVTKSLTIRGNDSSSMPVIDGMGLTCMNITVNSVTLQYLNFTNATNAINCSASGFTIVNNTFYYNDNGLYWRIYKTNLAQSQTILASTINDNTFYSNSSEMNKDMIFVDLELYYLNNSGYTVSIGAITVTHNTFFINETTYTNAISISIYVLYLYGGTITMGALTATDNTINGGHDGFTFYGTFSQLRNVALTVGNFIVSDNLMMNQTSCGVEIDYYDGESWSGTTHAVFGELQIMDNNLQTTRGADGIDVNQYGNWYNYTGTANLQVGDMTIEDNIINVTGDGIYFEMQESGYGSDQPLADHSSVTMGDFTIEHNTVTTTDGDGVIIYIDDVGHYMYDYAAFTMGNFHCNDNTIATGYTINYDNISDAVHLTRGYYAGLFNAVTESSYQYDYSPDDTEWSWVHTNPVADPVNLSYYDWRTAVNATPPNMVGNVIYMHIISEDRYFQMNFTYWRQGGGGGFSYTRSEIIGGVVQPGVAYSHPNATGSGGDGIYVSDIDYIGEEMYDYATCAIGDIQFNDNMIHTTGISSYGMDISWIGDIGEDMYNHTTCTMGNIEVNGNTIVSENSEGIYLSYGDFGYDMGENPTDHCVFVMGDITCNNNDITSYSEGIDVSEIEDFGEDMYGTSTFTMGDIQFNENTVTSTDSYGMDLEDLEYYAYDMYDNTHFTMGNIEASNNTVQSYYDGIYVEIYSVGYDLYDNTVCQVGSFLFNDNTITSDDDTGLDFYYIEEIGYDMYDNAQFSMGDIQANYNTIFAGGGYGIYIEWYDFACYMGDLVTDRTSFIMGDMTCCYNNITSYDEGIYTEDIDDIGNDMYGHTTCTIGDIIFNHNTINSTDSSGLYLYDPEYFGYDMYDNSVFTMGNLESNNNTITAGDGNGIYIYYDEFGYYMGEEADDHCVFTMGDITCNDNTITNSGDYGIYVEYLYYIGYDIYGDSSFTMGNIEFNRNWINTSDDIGMYFDDVYDFGYEMYDSSQFTMGDFQVNDNYIMSYGDGIYVYYLTDFGEDLNNEASFIMGNLTFNNNTIISSDGCGMNIGDSYDGIYYFGYDMYDSSSFEMGDVQFTMNNISSYNEGIYFTYLSDFGEYMNDDSTFTMGSVLINNNLIVSDSSGLFIGGPTGESWGGIAWYGEELYDNATATMDNIEVNNNNITADGYGIYSDIFECGYDMAEDAMFTMGDIQMNDNQINSTDYGIFIDWLGEIGDSIYDNAQVTIGAIEINHNYLDNGWGDGIDFWLGQIGYDLNNNASVTVKQIAMVQNTIISGDDGITDEWSGEFGYDIYDDAVYNGHGLIIALNTVDVANDGIRILDGTDNLIVAANTILHAGQGIHAKEGSYNLTIAYNTMNGTTNDGILFDTIYNSTILGNFVNASQNDDGVALIGDTHDITIVRNTIYNNDISGINVTTCYSNLIYHNNILNNTLQAYDGTNASNTWDDGYPSGGNYWSDYTGVDANHDGIGDTPYNITGYSPNDQDRYPLTDRVVINHPSLYTPSAPSPANGASGVSIYADLGWTGGDPDNDYDCYDIYLGTTSPPTYYDTLYFVQGTSIGYELPTLTLDTTYYWQIVAWDAFNDSVSGPVWTFSTGSPVTYGEPPVINHYAPTADPDGPYNGVVNTPIQFDGTGSHTNGDGGSIVEYDWSFYANDSFHNLGPSPTHTYTTAGTYKVTLRVIDSEDAIGIDSTSAVIRGVNTAPNAPTIVGSTTGNVNTAYTYSCTATDPDNNKIEYVIDWGDGSTKTTSPFGASGLSYSASHTWTTSGIYTIRVYAQDTEGGISGTATLVVTIGTPTGPTVNGYLVDTNGDGVLDSWHNNLTGQTTTAQKQADGTWLIDVNGDGVWDYVYNPVTGTYSPYSPAPGGLPDWLIWGGAALIIIIIFILFFLLWRRRKKNEEQEQQKK